LRRQKQQKQLRERIKLQAQTLEVATKSSPSFFGIEIKIARVFKTIEFRLNLLTINRSYLSTKSLH
jgi:hypothetical protein